mmetsp:Transcript_25510/g.72198  ORF Transcript_25510/g.72198 Transcript_25510/m.72198 type:complete len:88 (+) Transcript_25510:99-362(+)
MSGAMLCQSCNTSPGFALTRMVRREGTLCPAVDLAVVSVCLSGNSMATPVAAWCFARTNEPVDTRNKEKEKKKARACGGSNRFTSDH